LVANYSKVGQLEQREDVGGDQEQDTPTKQFTVTGRLNAELHVPKEIIPRRIQDITSGINEVRKSDHYSVVWGGYPLKKDYTWKPIE
jgi:hypothetical protein